MEGRNVLECVLAGDENPTNLPLALLRSITDNFSEERKIGEGGFGKVYMGVLRNGNVAVKRIDVTTNTLDDKTFCNEFNSLMQVFNHPNVVRFLGFCHNTEGEAIRQTGSEDYVLAQIRERLLCFEYVSNGSLEKYITDELRGLEWDTRYRIIKGICEGLQYLHMKKSIIHMDLKPANILLDDDMIPKITDFGLSRSNEKSCTAGQRFGTEGYIAPEYKNDGKISFECDIYSLGVIIIELISRRKDALDNNSNVKALRRWRHRWKKPPTLRQYQQLTKCMEIAEGCIKQEPKDRPSICTIIHSLSEAKSTNVTIDQIMLYSDDDMLGLEPLELRHFDFNKQITTHVELTNETKHYFAFHIKTTSLLTQLDEGIVSPGSKHNVILTLHAQEKAPQRPGEITVQSTKVEEGFTAKNIKDLFKEEARNVDEVNLTVVYEHEKPKRNPNNPKNTKAKTKRMVESASIKDKPGASATRQADAIPTDINNSMIHEDVQGKCTEQPAEHLSFPATLSTSRNQQTDVSNGAVDIATGAMGSLLHKLDELLKEEYNLEEGVRRDIESFSVELEDMREVLCKVSEVQQDKLTDKVKRWANSVKEMSYDIEDVVDGFLVHSEHASNTGFFTGLMQNMFNLLKRGKTHNLIGDAIKDIEKQVQDAANRRRRFKVDESVANAAAAVTIDPRISALYKDQKELVGIKEPRDELIKLLSDKNGNGDVSKQLKLVSIVGFGGLGKTTLAKAVFDKLHAQFQPRAFVSVGRNPVLKNTLKEILRCCSYSSAENLNENQLIAELRELLRNKRYFIVIDDIWDSSAWSVIQCAFPRNDCGSSVLTTSRIRSVADDCCKDDRGYVYKMKPLNDEDSRKLFISRILRSQETHLDVPEAISADILKKCGGLPLAIISTASLLAHNPRSRWDSVRNSLVSMFEGDQDELKDMEQILDLSYMHLPDRIKTCLLDIGKYREDCEIEKETLLRQWVAQGFVSRAGARDAEDVAEDCFYTLINMSMIQPWTIDYNDEVQSCKIHDITLDLVRSKAAEENFNLVIDGPEVMTGKHKMVRRVSILYDGEETGAILAAINGSLLHVRSVLLSRGSLVPPFLVLKYVRVLHLEDVACKTLDLTGIRGLFLLRYLKVVCSTNGEYVKLPDQIGRLRQLETVEVFISNWLDKPTFLPRDITSLPRLSHLSYTGAGLVLPDGIGRLRSLRTLQGVALLESSVDNIKGIGELTYLRALKICSTFHIYDEKVHKLEWKMRMDALRSSVGRLSGSLRNFLMGYDFHNIVPVLDWTPAPKPRRLWNLDLFGIHFPRIPEWIAHLHDLCSLELLVTEVADGLSIVAGLPSLASFRLQILVTGSGKEPKERAVISGSGKAFRALKNLHLICPYLSLAFEAGALPSLEKLGLCFHYSISAQALPVVGIEHLPAGTLRQIRLVVDEKYLEIAASELKQHRATVELLLKGAFEPHHPAADITIFFGEFVSL